MGTAYETDTTGPERVLCRFRAPSPGPTLICTAAIHGNEPAGCFAVERVATTLTSLRPAIRGEFVGLLGNRAALLVRQRFLHRDLNRYWFPEHIEALRSGQFAGSTVAEDAELLALHGQLELCVRRARGSVYVLDVHTTSGRSPPFATVADALRNRRFASHLPVPTVLGLDEHLDGTLLGYIDGGGITTLGFEAGGHDDASSVDNAEAAIWLALAAAGVLVAPESVPAVRSARALLERAACDLPPVLEVRGRHRIGENDGFRMLPGFVSFQPVQAGQAVASNGRAHVRVAEKGRLLMPLYQDQGDDGFFLVREFRPAWLALSTWLRRLRLDAFLHWLPGVRRVRARPGTLVVNRRVAHWFALEVFHLLGYRRQRLVGSELVVSRRPET